MAAAAESILIRDVVLIDGTGAVGRRAGITIADQQIVAVAEPVPAQESPDETTLVIDGRKLWAVLASWDAHVHLANRPDSKDRAGHLAARAARTRHRRSA